MNKKTLTTALLAVCVLAALAAAGYGLYSMGMKQGSSMKHSAAITPAPITSTSTQATAPQAAPQGIAQGEDATRRHISAGLKAGDIDPVTGSKILYYHDPMVPARSPLLVR